MLRREEAAREVAQRRGAHLEGELEVCEAATSSRGSVLSMELNTEKSSLSLLRTSAKDAARRATLEGERARQEQTSEASLERHCAELEEECRVEALRGERVAAQLVIRDRESDTERCEQGELVRRLRQIQADTRVSVEDLRVARQRSLLVRDECQAAERSRDALSQSIESSGCENASYERQFQERRLQLVEHETRLECLAEAIEAVQAEGPERERRVGIAQEEARISEDRLATLQREVLTAQHEAHMHTQKLQTESEFVVVLTQELASLEQLRASDAHETAVCRRTSVEAEAALEGFTQGAKSTQAARDAVARQVNELVVEEEHHAAAVSGMRRSHHVEDLAFEDVQSELQVAFRRREALSEDLARQASARDLLATRLHRLRLEAAETDNTCTLLEDELARSAHELEDELVQQRRSQQELVASTESAREFHRREAPPDTEYPVAAGPSQYRDMLGSRRGAESCGLSSSSWRGLVQGPNGGGGCGPSACGGGCGARSPSEYNWAGQSSSGSRPAPPLGWPQATASWR